MAHVAMDTNNPLGQRPFSVMGGMGAAMGPVATPGDFDNNEAVLNALVSMGAITSQNAADIFDGHASLDDMAVNMTMINSALTQTGQVGAQIVHPLTPSVTVPASGAPSGGAAASAAQSPAGTKLLYTVDWTAGLGNLSVSPNSALADLGNALASHGMSLVNGQATSNGPVHYELQITILDSIGHAMLADAKSVLDALMKQIVGNNLSGSSIAVGAGGGPGLLAADSTWLIAGGAVAVLALLVLTRR